jgi:polysaccharide export outer membrane protein
MMEVWMRRAVGLVIFLILALFPLSVLAKQAEYRLGPGDHLSFKIWTWGNEPIQQLETMVRPDGKVSLAFGVIKNESYRLGSGDVLNIGVWGYQELQSPETVVRPDGKIAFPLVGESNANGLTPIELSQKLTLALREYVREPKVTVNVVKFRTLPLVGEFKAEGLTVQQLTENIMSELHKSSAEARITVDIVKFRTTRVYVLGEVNRPGLCEIEKDHYLLDAISSAGGFTKNANRKKVYLVRGGESNSYIRINLDDILKKGDLSQNYLLNDGDLLFLGRSGIDFVRDILPFITAAYQVNHFN